MAATCEGPATIMKKFIKILSGVCAAAVLCLSLGALSAAAEGEESVTQYGVTVTETAASSENDWVRTVTMTSQSKANDDGGSWFYIGEVDMTAEPTSVYIKSEGFT